MKRKVQAVYRSATTGLWVSKAYGERYPHRVVRHRFKIKRRRRGPPRR